MDKPRRFDENQNLQGDPSKMEEAEVIVKLFRGQGDAKTRRKLLDIISDPSSKLRQFLDTAEGQTTQNE